MVKILERQLEVHFSKECKRLGLLTLKLNVRYARGWPDRLVVLDRGQCLWVELKTMTGRLSPLQQRLHRLLEQKGHVVMVLRSKEEISRVLESA